MRALKEAEGVVHLPRDLLDEQVLDLPDRLLDLLPIAVYVCDRDGLIVRYNRGAAELWGRSPEPGNPAERFCGSVRMYRLDGGSLPHAECPMAEVLRTGISVRDQEVVIERPDGSRAIALVNIDVLSDAQGSIVGAINCFHDITARKRIEEELRTSRRDLEDFFENTVVGMRLVGGDGIILRANQAELDLLGYTREEYVGRHIAEFHADRAKIGDILARLARGERFDKYPARLRAKDGSIKHVLISSNARFEDGELVNSRCVTVDVTASRRAEAALRESERRSRELLEALPAAVYTTDAAGRITFYNEAAVDLWGVRPELGKSEWCGSWRLYWPDGRPMPHDECPMAVALREGRPIRGAEAVAERPDGTRVPFIPYPTPLRDESGALTGAVNMLVDITEHKQVEQRVRETDARFGVIVAQVSAGVAQTDLTGRFELVNERYCEMVGYTPAELYRMRMQDITHPEDLPRNLELFQDLLRTGASFVVEKRYVRKDGAFVWVNNSVSSIRDSNGKLTNVVAVSVDVTERKRAEEVAARLVAIVESSSDAIVSKNLDGIILSWNRGAERLFGYAAEEVIGQPILILIPPDRHDEEFDILGRIRRGERIERYETVRRRKDGSMVEISLTVSPMKDARGRIIGASKIARDITERKRHEEARNLLLREMNHRVRNLFALAGSVVTLSARSAAAPRAMAEAVRERLSALARAHDLTLPDLAKGGAEGQTTATTLPALLHAIASPYEEAQRGKGRVIASGPEVPVHDRAVTSLALLLHEFAANSAKYGALSSPTGHVDVDWSVANDELQLVWKEEGGPRLDGPPDSEGFGSRLAHATVEGQLGGELSRDWRPEGLIVRLSVPLASLTA